MPERITNRDLEAVRERIERTLGIDTSRPIYTRDALGRNAAMVGRFYVDGAYGGVALYRIDNEAGGVEDVFRSGHVTKRELYDRMQAFLDGIAVARDA